MKSPPILVYASQNRKIINNELFNFNSEYCISIVLKNAISRRDFARHRFAFDRKEWILNVTCSIYWQGLCIYKTKFSKLSL